MSEDSTLLAAEVWADGRTRSWWAWRGTLRTKWGTRVLVGKDGGLYTHSKRGLTEVGPRDVRGAPVTREEVGERWRSRRDSWKRRVIEEIERGDYHSNVLRGVYRRLRLNNRTDGRV